MHASNGAMSPRPSPTTLAVHSPQHAATRVPPAPTKPTRPFLPHPRTPPAPAQTRCCRDSVQPRVLLSRFIIIYDCSHQGSYSTTSPRGAVPPLSPERRAPAPCHRPSLCSHHDHPKSALQSCAGTDWAAPFAPARSCVGSRCKCRPALPSSAAGHSRRGQDPQGHPADTVREGAASARAPRAWRFSTPPAASRYMGNIDAKRDWGHARDYVRPPSARAPTAVAARSVSRERAAP